MGKIIVSENVSLDGVVQDPTGEEGFDRGGWFLRISDRDRAGWAEAGLEEAQRGEALLLGRRTEGYFAARWPSRTGVWADRLNGMPKYVVSATLDKPQWTNSTILTGDPVAEAAKLKQELAGEIVVAGSTQLVHALLAHDLVDELRLIVFPVVIGAGRRMFGEMPRALLLRLAGARAIGDNLTKLTYQRTTGA
jgi:dihydrofolate reductase